MTLAELLVGPARADRITDAVAVLTDLEVAEQAFPPGAAVELATLRAGSGLRMPDCCVLLAARDAGARLASFDASLTRAAANLGIETFSS